MSAPLVLDSATTDDAKRQHTQRWRLSGRWGYPVALLLLTMLFFGQPLVHKKISEPLDFLAYTYPWKDGSPERFADTYRANAVENYWLNDATGLILPNFHFAREQVLHGHFALWTPYLLGGAPLFANDSSAVLYPPNVVAYLLPEAVAAQALMMLKIFGAGLGMYFFLGALSLRRMAAFLGAIAFMFSSYMVLLLVWQHSSTAMWLPWTFLCIEKALLPQRHRARWLAALATVTGVHLLSGHGETSAFILLAAGVYVAWWALHRAWMHRNDWRSIPTALVPAALIGGAVALGLAFAAIQLLPTLQYFVNSYPYFYREHVLKDPIAGPRALVDLAYWLIPNLDGDPAYNAQGLTSKGVVYVFDVGYVGVAPLILAALSFTHPLRARRFHRYAFLLLLALAWSVFYGINPVYTLFHASPLRSMVIPYVLCISVFAMATLAAIGFDAFLERIGEPVTWRWNRWREQPTLAGAGFVIVTAGFAVGAAFISKTQTLRIMQRFARDFTAVNYGLWSRSWAAFAFILLLIGLILLVLIAVGRVEPRLGAAALILLLVGDLFSFGVSYNTQASPSLFYPSTPITQMFQAYGPDARYMVAFHIEPPDDAKRPNSLLAIAGIGNLLSVRDLGGYDSLIPFRTHEFTAALNRNGTAQPGYSSAFFNDAPDRQLLAIGNVTHVLLNTEKTEPPGTQSHLIMQREDAAFPLPYMLPGVEEAQTFSVPADGLNALSFRISTGGTQPKVAMLTLQITDMQTHTIVATRDVSAANVADKEWMTVTFPPIMDSAKRLYRASLTPHADAVPGTTPALYVSLQTQPREQRFFFGQPVTGALQMRAYIPDAMDSLVPVSRYGVGTLYAVKDARPRVYVANGIVPAKDREGALTLLDRLHVPGMDAVIENPTLLTSAGGAATILDDQPGDITVRVTTDAPGTLILNEGYGDGGWRATTDGKATPVLHANYLYQGVTVPAGVHTVHFRYLPTSFVAGAGISLTAGLGIIALLTAPPLLRRRRRRAASAE